MRISTKLNDDEYTLHVTPVIIRLFASPDRALRVCLLDNLPHMIDHLTQKTVSDKIFPQMVTGFGDLAPVVREQTVKAVLVVTPKLTDRLINGELLRHLAKTANDEQPGIRTNTTICLGKIAKNLGVSSRAKVLSAAFSRALRDPFVHARNAALMALAATADVFSEDDCATKMLPAICPSLVDKEKMIREQANKTHQIYLDRIRKYQATLPDTVLPPPEAASAGATRMSTPQPGAAGASGQWIGWAVSSFTNKLSTAAGEIQPNGTGANTKPPLERTASSPGPATNGMSSPLGPRFQPNSSSTASLSKTTSSLRTAAVAPADEEDFGADDAWGNMNDDLPPEDDPWAEPTASSTPAQSSVAYDDGGEPDFEGWLNAQAQSKQASKKPLPKGLAKKAPPLTATKSAPLPRPTTAPRATTIPSTISKPAKPKPAPAATKEEDDDWGSAWD